MRPDAAGRDAAPSRRSRRGGRAPAAPSGSALPIALGIVVLSALLLAGLAATVQVTGAAEAGAGDAQRRRLALDDALARAAADVWLDTIAGDPWRPITAGDSTDIRVSSWHLPAVVWIAARHRSGQGAGVLVHRSGWPPMPSAWIGTTRPQLAAGARVEAPHVSPEADHRYRSAVRGVTNLANFTPPSLTVLSQDLDIGAGEVVVGCWLVRGAVRLGPDSRVVGRLAVADSLVLGDRAQVVGQVVMLSASATRLGPDALIRPLDATDADPCPALVAGARVAGGGWMRLP